MEYSTSTSASNSETSKPTFFDAMIQEDNYTLTDNGALTHISSLSGLVDLFYRSVRGVDNYSLERLFNDAYNESPLYTAKMIAYIRDIRGGKGEREIARVLLKLFSDRNPQMFQRNLEHYINVYGRWDDGICLEQNKLAFGCYLNLLKGQLEKDLEVLERDGENANISLCAKWIPSENKSIDNKIHFYGRLAKKMGISKMDLRKKYVSPLRKHLNLVETNLMRREYENINYSNVPSRCMLIHGKDINKKKEPNAFRRNDGERFGEYMEKLKTGEAKVNASVLYPHEIVQQYFNGASMIRNTSDNLVEAQWKETEEKIKTMGKLGKTLVLSDVSGSMSGTPMLISVSLGILISGGIENPAFKNNIITFHESPSFYRITGETLYDRIASIQRAPWGGNTDFYKVFTTILDRATQYRLKEEDMPERVVVISDMQFDVASRGTTNFEAIDKLYETHGYKRPQIVFWNVNGNSRDVPVTSNMADTALVSGFSVEILKAVLEGEGLTPKDIMLKAIMDSRYDLIV